MSDEKQSTTSPATADKGAPLTATTSFPTGPVQRPSGWMYKGFKIGKHEVWYASPIVQLIMVALVCFMCPGMFNAVTGLGAGGQLDPTATNDANTALYSTFAVVGFFSGTIANKLGVRITLGFGGLGYCIYVASLLSYNHNKNYGFVVFAGAFLGVCAGLLWTAQGTIMMSYPPEKNKGRYISLFWGIFNLGGVIGSLVPLGQNIHTTNQGTVNDGTYIGFIVLTIVGAMLSLALVNANRVVRHDGSKVILMANPTWKTELKGLLETITGSPWVVLLFPMFFASNSFYTYQLNNMNGAHFNVRTRSLNSVLYWSSQIVGAIITGFLLDFGSVRRSVRAKASFVALFIISFAIWGGGWAWQRKQAIREVATAEDYKGIDWTDGGEQYIAPMFLFMFYAFFDAVWQTCIYWYMGALSNSGRKAANLTGFYKGIQSAGAAVFWRLDAVKTPYNKIFGGTWGLLAGALLFAAPVIFLKIKDTVSIEEDLKFSDETVADVAPVREGGAVPPKEV